MILVDSSVWIDHLRNGNPWLSRLLEQGQVVTHEFVIGELACGRLRERQQFLWLLGSLPLMRAAEHREVLDFIEAHNLSACGLGWVDLHLLSATMLNSQTIWSMDKQLTKQARALGVSMATSP